MHENKFINVVVNKLKKWFFLNCKAGRGEDLQGRLLVIRPVDL